MSAAELIGMEFTEFAAKRARMTVAEREVFERRERGLNNVIQCQEGRLQQLEKEIALSKKRNRELYDEMVNWQECASYMSKGMNFYRDIVTECGEMLGEACYTSDDGSIQDHVLALKVPIVLFSFAHLPPATFLGKIRTMFSSH